jgi:hypothetical protein
VYFPHENLVLEINGTTHYFNLSKEKMPKYRLKQLLFDSVGLNYMDIDYHDYLDENREVRIKKLV